VGIEDGAAAHDVVGEPAPDSIYDRAMREVTQRGRELGGGGYRLAAEGRERAEDERLALLEEVYDPPSRQLRDLIQPGWRCLEVGAGRGSVAAWMAERVGSSGAVVATDVDVRYLERLEMANLSVHRHDILGDPLDELGQGSFDVVCARLVLFWLPGEQQTAIARMASLLRPGGWFVDEDGDWGTPTPADPSHPLSPAYESAFGAGEWWASRGYDPFFGRKLPALLDGCGLTEISHSAKTEVVRGGSPWARWWQLSLEAITLASDPTERDLGDLASLSAPCTDPTAWLMRELLHSCVGRR
jgi:SAM-dependent methyltransferase